MTVTNYPLGKIRFKSSLNDIRKKYIEQFFLYKDIKEEIELKWFFTNCLYRLAFLYEHNIFFDAQLSYHEDTLFVLNTLCYCNLFITIPKVSYIYIINSQANKYPLKSGESNLHFHKKCMEIIEEQNLSHECLSALNGKTFVGINTYIQALINRQNQNLIKMHLHNSSLKEIMWTIIKMNRQELNAAQLSYRQKLAAFFYLLGNYKMARRFI